VAKPSKERDRRAVIEQMRLEQQRSERRRTYAVVAACSVVALVIVGLGAYPLLKQKQASAGSLASIGASVSDAGCRPTTTKGAIGNNDHRAEGSAIFYPDAPPAFGPHYPVPVPMARKFYTRQDRPHLPYLVHNLEHGYTLLWYDPTVAANGDELRAVKAIASKFAGTTNFKDKFIAVPWTDADGKSFPAGAHVALTHWSMGGTHGNPSGQIGVWQYCAKPSGEAVQRFVRDYPFTDSPEPQGM
jgi:hypothetical protein